MNANDFDNYWVQSPEAHDAPAEPSLQFNTIEGVEPLDAQLGIIELKTVPDALHEPLFGQHSGVPLHTYAILDAAKVPNLPELLNASGLIHKCFFKGDAYDELKDVAPWIVQLEDDNAFTRNLFTKSDAPWHLWDTEPGIYLRSYGTLNEMWKHLRKFTKVQDEDGKWLYFRFWEPRALTALIVGGAARLPNRLMRAPSIALMILVSSSQSLKVKFEADYSQADGTSASPILDNFSKRVLGRQVHSAFLNSVRCECAALSDTSVAQTDAILKYLYDEGFRSRISLRNLVVWLSTAEGEAAIQTSWGRRELTQSHGMPDLVREQRLRNLAQTKG